MAHTHPSSSAAPHPPTATMPHGMDVSPGAAEATRVLEAIRRGEPRAASDLLPLVYDELRRMAAQKMAGEAPGHTLQATALVHEAWLRLVSVTDRGWENRAHFFGAAAEAMRRILVEHARRKQAHKRGGGAEHSELDADAITLTAPADELLAVNDALESLAADDPEAARLVKLRYFVGLTMDEAAEAMGLPKRTAESLWTYARIRLLRKIRSQD